METASHCWHSGKPSNEIPPIGRRLSIWGSVFFGWKGLLFVGGAMLIALITGLVFTLLDELGWIEGPARDVQAENVS